MPRGRSKQPKAYSNRTDLSGKVAAGVGGEMPYGEKAKLMEGQKAVPVSPQDVPKPPDTDPAMPMNNSVEGAVPTNAPTVVPFGEPTQFPNQTLASGIAGGIDAPDQDMLKLKKYLPMFESYSNMQDSPEMFRQFVSWMREQ